MRSSIEELDGIKFKPLSINYLKKILIEALSIKKGSDYPSCYEKVGITCRMEYVPELFGYLYYFPAYAAILITYRFDKKRFIFENKSYRYHSGVIFDSWRYRFFVLEGEK